MEILYGILIIGTFVGLIIWGFKYAKKVNARKQKLYEEFALTKGLEHIVNKVMLASINTVRGTLGGCEFMFYEKLEGSGKNRHMVSYVFFYNCPFTFDFKIGKENFFSKTGKKFGKQDITVGDEEFDQLFLLKSKSEQELKDLLNYDIQNELKMISDDLKDSIKCKDRTITYSVYGGLSNEKAFKANQRVIEFIVKLIEKSERRR